MPLPESLALSYYVEGCMAVCMTTIDRYIDCPHARRWVLIFEKAWAKLHGSYEATAGGLTCDTLNYLCGGLTRHISTRPTAATADAPASDPWALLCALTSADAEHRPFMSAAGRERSGVQGG